MKKIMFFNVMSAPLCVAFFILGVMQNMTPFVALCFSYVLYTVGSMYSTWNESIKYLLATQVATRGIVIVEPKMMSKIIIVSTILSIIIIIPITGFLGELVSKYLSLSEATGYAVAIFTSLAFVAYCQMKQLRKINAMCKF